MRIRHPLRTTLTTLALSLAVTALTPPAWATNYACQLSKFKIRYYASEVDPYHNKHVIAYCDPGYKAISCEAEIFSAPDSSGAEASKYFVALNEIHEYHNSDHSSDYYNRDGCWARANTFYANYDRYHGDPSWQPPKMLREESGENYPEPYGFEWGLKVYATCVPQYCVEKYQGEGSYDYYEHTSPEPVEVPIE